MKQILFLLLLLPCLCLAQYTGNANQKITLGEQTTADGLVYRGVLNDTANITPLSDTSAYIILDTVNNKFYNYNRSTNVWSLAGGGVSVSSFSAGTTGLTPNTETTGAVTLGGTLAVANGGTGITSLGTGVATFLATPTSANLATAVTNETGSGALVFGTSPTLVTPALGTPTSGVLTSATGLPLATGVTGVLPVANGGTNRTTMPAGYILHGDGTSVDTAVGLFWDRNNQRLGIGTNAPLATLQVNGDTRFNNSIFGNVQNKVMNIGTSGFEDDYIIVGFDAYWGISHRDNGSAHDFGIDVYNGGTPKNALTILNNGEVLMGFTTDQGNSILSVNGNVSANGSVLTSDKRFKENIMPLKKALEIVNKLNPVTFNFINDTDNNFSEFEEVGFIAQDVDRALSTETFAKSIVKNTDESDIDSKMVISLQNLIPILTKAIQEQQALIKALEQRILTLENK